MQIGLLTIVTLLGLVLTPAQAKAQNFVDQACYDVCANACNAHWSSSARRRCRDGCSRTCTRIGNAASDVGNDIEKMARAVRDTGATIVETAESLWNAANDSDTYPTRLSNTQIAVDSPSLKFKISSSFVKATLTNLAKTSFSTSDDISNNYIQLSNPRITFDPVLNIIVFESGGTLAGEFKKLRGAIKFDEIRIDIAPVVAFRNERYYLDLFAKITYLDFKDTPPKIDKYIASVAQYLVSKDKPLMTMEISNFVEFNVDVKILDAEKKVRLNRSLTVCWQQGAPSRSQSNLMKHLRSQDYEAYFDYIALPHTQRLLQLCRHIEPRTDLSTR